MAIPATSLRPLILALAVLPGAAALVCAGVPAGDGAVPGIAGREVERRAARTATADAKILEARDMAAQGQVMPALDILASVRAGLPEAPLTIPSRAAARDAYASIALREAARLAAEARYDEARMLLRRVLDPSMDPDNREARQFLTDLDDPDLYPPARSPAFAAKVAKVEAGLRDGADLIRDARYQDAILAYEEVLRLDRYNSAARAGMESAERAVADYMGGAYNHTRARMLGQVARGWETRNHALEHKTTADQLAETADASRGETEARNRRELLTRKIQRLVIDQIDFDGASLRDAIDTIKAKSRAADKDAERPEDRGINIVLDIGNPDDLFAKQVLEAEVSLQLRQVPLQSLLEYVAREFGLAVRVEPFAVVLVPASEAGQYLFTRSYSVPPDFIASVGNDTSAPANDPFAAAAADQSLVIKRLSPKEFLEQSGISFPKDAFAVFDARNSILTMRNTAGNHDLVEDMVQRSKLSLTPQVLVETRMIEVSESDLKELGFDWLLGAFNLNSGVFAAGGSDPRNVMGDLPLQSAFAENSALGPSAVTAGNRSGSQAITGNMLQTLLNSSSTSALSDARLRAPAALSLAGVLSEPRFQVVMRALSQSKGKDFLNAPSVVTRSGMPAKIEVIREFIYPTEYDPPEIPNSVDTGGGSGGNTPVTPATPTAFDMKPIGTILEVEPVVSPDGTLIEVNYDTLYREFLGFVNYGSPIYTLPSDSSSDRVPVTENRILQPIFETRRLKSSNSVYTGQTLVIGGLLNQSSELVEDKVPLLGDTPLLGRFFKSNVKQKNRYALLIFLKVDTLDPSGQPMASTAPATGP